MITQNELDFLRLNIPLNIEYAKEYISKPTPSEYKDGEFLRFFVKKVNDTKIIEVSKDSFNNSTSMLYKKISVVWKISGSKNNVYFNGGIQINGVYESNVNRVKEANSILPGISDKLTNPLEFYKIDGIM